MPSTIKKYGLSDFASLENHKITCNESLIEILASHQNTTVVEGKFTASGIYQAISQNNQLVNNTMTTKNQSNLLGGKILWMFFN